MKTLNELNINIESLPEWANYIAMDRNGEWFAYEKKPVLRRHLNDWWNPERGKVRLIKVSYKCENWEESLYKIERMENKQEKHKWYNEIVAFAEGKEIQARSLSGKLWVTVENPQFNDERYVFRVKPEPKYIPFTFEDREVFRGKWIRNKATNSEFIITLIEKKKVDLLSYDQAFYKWEFLDGTPFGKLEGGSDE